AHLDTHQYLFISRSRSRLESTPLSLHDALPILFAVRSQAKAAAAQASGRFDAEIVAVEIPQRKGDPVTVARDEHPRETSVEALRSEEHTSELQSQSKLVCRLLLEQKNPCCRSTC